MNENNRFVMSYNPVDLRKGVDSLCGAVRSCQLDSLNGDVYVFSNVNIRPTTGIEPLYAIIATVTINLKFTFCLYGHSCRWLT